MLWKEGAIEKARETLLEEELYLGRRTQVQRTKQFHERKHRQLYTGQIPLWKTLCASLFTPTCEKTLHYELKIVDSMKRALWRGDGGLNVEVWIGTCMHTEKRKKRTI